MVEQRGGRTRPRRLSFLSSASWILLVAFAVLSLAPGRQATHAAGSQVLIMPFFGAASTLDPAIYYDIEGCALTTSVYEGLIRYRPGSTAFEGVLATGWDVSRDGKLYTFHLRHGVRFQDGTPFNAAAAKFSFMRVARVNQGPAYMVADVARMDTPDDYTFKVTLRQPVSSFLSLMASMWGPKMISPTFVHAHEVKGDLAQAYLTDHASGSGPYVLTRYVPNQEYVLAQNPGYWRGWSGAHLKKLIFKIIPELSTQRLALEHGEADILTHNIPVTDAAALASEPGITVQDFPTNLVGGLYLNLKRGATANLRVRQALAYLIPYDQVANTILKGHAVVLRSTSPNSFPTAAATPWSYRYNLAKARALLAEAGYSHGFSLDYVYGGDSEVPWRQVGELLQASLAPLGITMTVRTLPSAVLNANLKKPDQAPQMLGAIDTPDTTDAYAWYDITFGSRGFLNYAFYNNSAVDRLLDRAVHAPNAATARGYYSKISAIVSADLPFLFVYGANDVYISRAGVHGITHNVAYPWITDFYAVYKN